MWRHRPNLERPLLSRVRDLNLYVEDFAGLALRPRLVVGLALRSVHLDVYRLDPNMALPFDNVLSVLKSAAPSIQVFSCTALGEYGEVTFPASADLMQLIQCFENIESLDLYPFPITNNTFAHLSALPKLRKLSIRNDDSDIAHYLANSSNTSCFRSLRELTMYAQGLDFCSKVIECRGLQQLESLSIEWVDRDISWELSSFFQSLHDHCSHFNIRYISLYGEKFGSPEWPFATNVPVVTPGSILPLLSFTNMVSFHMDLDNIFDLDDSCLNSISAAWPRLQRLHFCQRSLRRTYKITLQGLVPLIAIALS